MAATAATNLVPLVSAASRTCVNVEPRGIARRPLEKPACPGAGRGRSDSFHRARLSVLGVGLDDSPSSPFHLEASQARRSRGREFTQPRKTEVRVRLYHNPMTCCAVLLHARREDLMKFQDVPPGGGAIPLLQGRWAEVPDCAYNADGEKMIEPNGTSSHSL